MRPMLLSNEQFSNEQQVPAGTNKKSRACRQARLCGLSDANGARPFKPSLSLVAPALQFYLPSPPGSLPALISSPKVGESGFVSSTFSPATLSRAFWIFSLSLMSFFLSSSLSSALP